MPRQIAAASLAVVLAVFTALGASAAPVRAADLAGPSASPAAPEPIGPLEGIDVSRWQGTINWSQVAAAGKSFVIMKATEGETFKDPNFNTNIAGARAAGVRPTAYHFAQPGNPASEAIIQANWFIDTAGLKAGDMIPALDLEVSNGLTVAELQAWVMAFLTQVEARLGVKAMIYVSPAFWSKYMGNTTMFAAQGYTLLWVAHWFVSSPSVPASNWGGHGWTFWQYDDCGSVPGIGGCVDLDRYNGTDLTPVVLGPAAPTAVVGEPGDGQVAVAWRAPAVVNGPAINDYTVTASPGGATCSTSGALTCTVTGLTNGLRYTFTVRASNTLGAGPVSAASPEITPRTVPAAPGAPAAQPGVLSAQVDWTASSSDGGSPILGYTAKSSPGGKTCVTNGATSCTVTGLDPLTPYTFTVTATNEVGASPASSPTNQIVPKGPGPVVRYAGTNRFGTAAATSAATFSPGVPVAFIAYAYNFPDALAGAAAAGHLGGPILYSDTSGTLNSATATELARLAPQKIVVLGGTSAISDSIMSQLGPYSAGP